MDEQTEQNLIGRCKNGDWSAFDTLVEAHQESVYRLAYGLTGSHDDADTVTQDAFMQAYNALSGFAGRSRLMTWLYSIAVRIVGNMEKGRRGRPRVVNFSGQPETDCDGRHPALPGPSEIVENEELLDSIVESVKMLPFEQRAALVLVAMEGLSYRRAFAQVF